MGAMVGMGCNGEYRRGRVSSEYGNLIVSYIVHLTTL